MSLNNLGLGMTVSAKDATQGVFEGVNDKLAKTQEAVEKISAVELGDKFKEWGMSFKEFGSKAFEGLRGAWEEASHFNKGIAETSTLIDEAKFAQKDMNDIVLKMANEYGQDLASETKSLYQAISSGATNASSATQILAAANKLAEAGVTDTTTALTGLTKVLNNYNMDFSKANEVSDAFFVAVKDGQTTIGELGTYIGDLAAGASNAGVKMEELVAALGTGSTLMRDTGAAATGLKAALANIANPTADAAAEAARLGIKFDAASLRAKGLVGFLESITGSANYNKDTLTKLFGSIEAVNAITALTGNNMSALKSTMDDMAHKAGGTDKAFDKLSQTSERLHQQLISKLQVAAVKIGEIFEPLARILLKVAQQAVDAFNEMPEFLRKGLVLLVAGGAAALVFIGGVLGLAGAVLALGAAIDFGLLPALEVAIELLIPLVPIIGAVGLALYGLKVAYDKNLGGIADRINEWISKIKLAFGALSQLFENGEVSGPIADDLGKAENRGVLKFVQTIFLWGKRLEHFFDEIGEGFDNVLKTMDPVFQSIKDGLDKILQTIGLVTDKQEDGTDTWNKWGKAGMTVGVVLGEVFQFLVEVFDDLVHLWSGIVQGFHKAMPTSKQLSGAINNLEAAFQKLAVALGLTDEKTGDSSNGFEILGKVIGVWVGGAARLITMLANSMSFLIGVVATIIDGMRVLWNVVLSVSGAVTDAGTAIGHGIGDAFKSVRDRVQTYINEIKQFIDQLVAKVEQLVSSVKNATDTVTGGGAPGAGGGARGRVTGAIGHLLPGGLGSAAPATSGAEAQAQQGGQISRLAAAVQSSGGGGGVAGELKNQITVQLHLDGEKIAEVNTKNTNRLGARKLLPF